MSNSDLLGYEGKTVVVTGCSSGMGRSAARILGELGAHVHAVDLNEPSIPHETFHRTDLADPSQVSTTAASLRELGPIHYLFNCAGVAQTLGAMTCMRVNYLGNRQITEELLPALDDGAGIAIISSNAGMGWKANLAVNLQLLAIADPGEATAWCEAHPEMVKDGYSTSKEMLIVWALHRCIALGEERGIRINCIAPGPTQTAFTDQAAKGLPDGFFDRFPYPLLGRIATADEQGWPLVLLNSALMNVVTGAVLYTDQGFAGGLFTGALDAGHIMGRSPSS